MELFDAVCSECGKACKVPFKPDLSRPVYCRECWDKRRPSRPRREDRGRRPQRDSYARAPKREFRPGRPGRRY